MTILLGLLCSLLVESRAQSLPVPAGASFTPTEISPVRLAEGDRLARAYCQSCHLFPEPELLDRKTWLDALLPRMKIRVGLAPELLDRHPEAKLLKATGLFPSLPMMTPEDWQAIVDYYAATAPETIPPQDPRPDIKVGLRWFKPEPARARHIPPLTTMVQIVGDKIYAGDAKDQSIDVFSGNGNLVDSFPAGNVPVSIADSPAGLLVAMIGSFMPSDNPKGELVLFPKADGALGPREVLQEHLPRTTHVVLADLNGDGLEDYILCIYGNNVGRFSWFENPGSFLQPYKEHVLYEKSGALRCEVRDMNGDKFPDLVVLVAQETESMMIFHNNGKGEFTRDLVFQKHPLTGHSSFELADFNNDGKPDLLVTNGDNGEYPSPAKKYHGARIYLNKGGGKFEESYFFPMNGAYKAVARDFDQDGDLDIAAISFFPDYDKSPKESFVLLENQGNLQFSASTFRECISGRWLVMDAGDIDGDGDIDIVLGSFTHGPSVVPDFLSKIWQKDAPSVEILRNQLKSPAPKTEVKPPAP